MKLVSMSLYGDKPMYLQGALANARLLPEIYPGWTLRIYCEPKTGTETLEAMGCEIVKMIPSKDHSGMFWRFLPAWDLGMDMVIFRDADSRFNVREAAAVKAWEESGLTAHCMHDHKHHSRLPLMGGMWGIRPGVLPRRMFHSTLKMSRRDQPRVSDMHYLARHIHPLIQPSLLRHSSVKMKGVLPYEAFPKHEPFEGFVGQQYDDNGDPIWV